MPEPSQSWLCLLTCSQASTSCCFSSADKGVTAGVAAGWCEPFLPPAAGPRGVTAPAGAAAAPGVLAAAAAVTDAGGVPPAALAAHAAAVSVAGVAATGGVAATAGSCSVTPLVGVVAAAAAVGGLGLGLWALPGSSISVSSVRSIWSQAGAALGGLAAAGASFSHCVAVSTSIAFPAFIATATAAAVGVSCVSGWSCCVWGLAASTASAAGCTAAAGPCFVLGLLAAT